MKTLSIRQPWAWLILHAGKDIENRKWATALRGRVLIHAAKGMTHEEYDVALELAYEATGMVPPAPSFDALARGGIVGSVEIVGCVQESASPWFFGPFGFQLAYPVILPFQAWPGKLGFFEVPMEVIAT